MKMLWQLKFKAMDTNGGNMLFIGNKQIHLACSHFQQSISPMRRTYDFVWINFIFFFFALSSRRLFFYSISFYLPVYAALFSSRKLADREFLSSTETKLEFVTRDRFFLYHSFVGFIILSHQRFTMEICGHRKKYTIYFRCMCFFLKKLIVWFNECTNCCCRAKHFFCRKETEGTLFVLSIWSKAMQAFWPLEAFWISIQLSTLNIKMNNNDKHQNKEWLDSVVDCANFNHFQDPVIYRFINFVVVVYEWSLVYVFLLSILASKSMVLPTKRLNE